jgi:trehalose 6-phosphate synthase/phosphatase
MNSLRARRVIIASLFLPNAAVLGDARQDDDLRFNDKSKPASRIGSTASNLAGPLKSIVDDLKDKVFLSSNFFNYHSNLSN